MCVYESGAYRQWPTSVMKSLPLTGTTGECVIGQGSLVKKHWNLAVKIKCNEKGNACYIYVPLAVQALCASFVHIGTA